jgi:DNA-binding CsgD family transcriptional regulator
VGLWDSRGYLRCLISTSRPFTSQEKQTIEIIFHHLNNLFQNLLTTPSIAGSSSPKLTKREQQVGGQLILQGADRQAIADRLHISPATVAKHIANMHHMLGVQSQQELMLKLFNLL